MIRYDADTNLLHVGERKYPVKVWRSYDEHNHSVRQAILEFENRWGLSVIWGSMTYSSNHHHDEWRRNIGHEPEYPEFHEEPACVEVGVFGPEPRIIPGLPQATVDFFQGKYPAPPEVREQMMQDRETPLACDPFGWLAAEDLSALADYVMKLPSHPEDSAAVEAIGAELEKEEWREHLAT